MVHGRPALAARRTAAGLTQEALAELLGVDRSTVVRWELGRTTPQPWVRTTLAHVLGVTLADLDGLLARPAATPPLRVVRSAQHGHVDVSPADEELRDRLAHAASVDDGTLSLLAAQADANRELDRALGAGVAYPQLLGYLDMLDSLRRHTIGNREALADLYADAAALAGWQSLDTGRLSAAWDHHEHAKVVGREGGFPCSICARDGSAGICPAGAAGNAAGIGSRRVRH